MEKRTQLSAVIITFNEERNIERCLESLKDVADEIIVVDSFSTDRTKDICEARNVKFIQHNFEGHIQQKNFAMEQASFDYVLSLDADEALDEKLQKSILREKENFQFDAYSFNRLTNYCGQWIRHCGWYPDKKLRIWNKNKGQWGGVNPHDKVVLKNDASVKHLEGDLLHFSYHNFSDHFKQIEYFTNISSKAAFDSGKRTNIFMIIVKPWFKFIRDYIIKLGFLDGFYGFVICMNSSYAKFLKYLKLYELQRKNL